MTLTFSVTSTCFKSYWYSSALVTFTNCFWIIFLQTSQLSYQALQYRPFKTSVLLRESSTLWGLLLCKVSRTRPSPWPTPVPLSLSLGVRLLSGRHTLSPGATSIHMSGHVSRWFFFSAPLAYYSLGHVFPRFTSFVSWITFLQVVFHSSFWSEIPLAFRAFKGFGLIGVHSFDMNFLAALWFALSSGHLRLGASVSKFLSFTVFGNRWLCACCLSQVSKCVILFVTISFHFLLSWAMVPASDQLTPASLRSFLQ